MEQLIKKGIRIVAVSDTHASSKEVEYIIKNNIKGDIFVHAGDFTKYGTEQHFLNFINNLQRLQFKHKIVVAGNHDIALDNKMKQSKKEYLQKKYPCTLTREGILSHIKAHAHYLENNLIEIEGLKIYGSPNTIKYSKGAFQYPEEEDQVIWTSLPENLDILITHGPPFGILDQTSHGINAGSKGLLKAVQEKRPKMHIFGHIHQGHGRVDKFGVTFNNVAKKFEVIDFQ